MAGSQTESISVSVTKARDGQKYRCVVTGETGESVVSGVSYLTVGTVSGAPEITTQPKDANSAVGSTASFSVQANGSNLTYQWQYSNAASAKWYNSSMSGADTDTLNVLVTKARNGQKYRCIITDDEGRVVISEAGTIIVAE